MTKDQVRTRILLVAGEIFALRGYQSTTIRDICQRAKVNVAAVNYYFGDKERLYIDAVKHARELIADQWPLPEWSDETTPEQKLSMFVETFLQRLLCRDAASWRIRLILREIMDPTRACEELVQESFRPFFNVLLEVIREMVPRRTAAFRIHQLGLSLIGQCVFYLSQRRVVEMMVDADELDAHFHPQALAEHIVSFSVPGLRKPYSERTESLPDFRQGKASSS
ncbi:MAG: CerR family C-terminal domain-containing protein [Planctomycetaceae bacterium]|nr:CerR family C-terminal domain-containing protein [Planctomycetaceae bacterium]